jgi:hypothetical protein
VVKPSGQLVSRTDGPYELIADRCRRHGTVHLARISVVGDVYRSVAIVAIHHEIKAASDAPLQLFEGGSPPRPSPERRPSARSMSPHGVYLVTDYIEGPLFGLVSTARCARQHVPIPIAARILTDALAGLHAARAEGRDGHAAAVGAS